MVRLLEILLLDVQGAVYRSHHHVSGRGWRSVVPRHVGYSSSVGTRGKDLAR